jgi:FkbM family methyltransferase
MNHASIENPARGFVVSTELLGWRRLLWAVLEPVRAYMRHFPLHRGKGPLLRCLLVPTLPGRGQFKVEMPSGRPCWIPYRDRIGLRLLIWGSFELAELRFVSHAAMPGSTAIDVGANIGLFTAEMSAAVGPVGQVIAIEPLPNNAVQLRATIAAGVFTNVRVEECAAGADTREVVLNLAADNAYPSTQEPREGMSSGGTLRVRQRTLDEIWQDAGTPRVSFIKIDVEGAEVDVLRGASRLLRTCRPILLLEANTEQHRESLVHELSAYGYHAGREPGFEPWNYVFSAEVDI